MLSILWRILLFLSALWFVQRFLSSLFGPARRRAGTRSTRGAGKETANKMVKDPVCGMYLDPRLALPVESGKETIYFCSEDCRKKFLAQSK
jgi:uncharacterized protein